MKIHFSQIHNDCGYFNRQENCIYLCVVRNLCCMPYNGNSLNLMHDKVYIATCICFPFACIMNESGKIIVEPKYNGVESFQEGFAAVQISGDEKGVKSAFVDTTGKFVFGRTFGFVRSFSDGYAAVELNGRWGFIDRTGKTVIEAKYFYVNDFQEGLAIAGFKSGAQVKYGYIDKTGKFVLKPIYNQANPFHFGLASVKIGSKFGYIDPKGNVVIQPKFDNALSFQRETLGATL